MGQKLHRGRRSVFRKRRSPLKTILWLFVAVCIIGGGYLMAMLVAPQAQQAMTAQQETDIPQHSPIDTKPTQPSPTKPAAPTQPSPEDAGTVPTGIRGFYLPHAALTDAKLADTLSAAKQAGFTAVMFDLKDPEGQLYYRFTAPQAKQVNAYTKDALTKKQLTTLFQQIKKAGLTPVPRLYAFRDNLGAKALPNARIGLKSDASQSWYDGDPKASGSKRWLNPYDNDAHDYIGALAEELKALGAGGVMLDGVQFPRHVISAGFGTDNTTLRWNEVLTLFISKMKTRLGEECPVILTCTGESVLENATQIYGGNPLTFAPSVAAPLLPADKVREAVETIIARINVEENNKTLPAPMLDINGLSAAQVKQALTDCLAGGATNYILYHPQGDYAFAAYL